MPRGKRADAPPEDLPKSARAEAPPEPKSKQPALFETKPEPANAPEPLPIRDASPDGSDRISVKLIDGKFDTSSLRAKTAEKLQVAIKSSLADPEFCKAIGMDSASAVAVMEDAFKPEHFGMLLDGLVMMEVAAMIGKTGLTQPEVSQYMSWSPEEHAVIDPVGARVLSRYLPGEWLKYTDLVLLIITFASTTMRKMTALNSYAKEKLERIGRARMPEPVPPEQEEKAA
jgi:hypothetical protein